MKNKTSDRSGKWVIQQTGIDGFSSFIPNPLPPVPPLRYDNELNVLLERAMGALGRLDGVSSVLPDPDLFLFMFVRKEAVLSSQIEGTQSSLTDLIEFENLKKTKSSIDDVKEVSNYVKAMDYGVKRVKKLPISSRLLREMHKILIKGTRGGQKSPGEFRRSQNWVGGSKPLNARFVPPPHQEILNCMGDLEKFLNDPDNPMPIIIKAGLAHIQFETIHPFLDGNGRIGRLLITLILLSEKLLERPLLYLSLFFKKHRDEYYDRLNTVRTEGDWEGWIKFYLNGVYEVSREAVKSARSIINLKTKHSAQVGNLRKASDSALKLLELLYKNPIQTVGSVSKSLKLSAPSSRKAIYNLINLGILSEITGKKRDREYWYDEYLSILLEDEN